VASDIGAIPEIVEDGYNGRLFEAGNVNGLKSGLESLIENPAELQRLSRGAFESVKKYDIDECIIQLQEIYHQVMR